MDINRNTLGALFTGFKNNFATGFDTAPDTWSKFATAVQSSTAASIYPFLEQFGGMREWKGDRQIKNLTGRKIEVVNRDFEDTVAIPGNDIEDDMYGIYSTMIAQMGYHAGKIWQDLAVEALTASTNWIDGSAFFATNRKYGSETISNTATGALSATTYAAAREAMMKYRGHNGRSLSVVPNLLIVGPKLESTAFAILKDSMMLKTISENSVSGVGATNNPWNGSAELLVLPELGDSATENLWFLAATNGVLKPLVVQQRKMPVLASLDRETDENVFARKEYLYGTNARGEAFLAFPHLIYKGGTSVA